MGFGFQEIYVQIPALSLTYSMKPANLVSLSQSIYNCKMIKIISQPGNCALNEAIFGKIFIIKSGAYKYLIHNSCLAIVIAIERKKH